MTIAVLYAVALVVAFATLGLTASARDLGSAIMSAAVGFISAASVAVYSANTTGGGAMFYLSVGLMILEAALAVFALWTESA